MRLAPLLLSLSLALTTPINLPLPAMAASLDQLTPDSGPIRGFKPLSRYRDAAGQPFGGRFVHQATGFTLDLLNIQSVPQALVWVTTWPTSDMGEPHTQEHLLLGKGNMGRGVATLESMSLTESTAYTEQRRTVYAFNTTAGPETFYNLMERRLDALLHPNYTDEEIRREVRNFGVTEAEGGTLRLEEQGTVYNEMSSTFEKPWTRAYREMARDLYGPDHPLSNDAGGTPEALRVLSPADIRKFHAENYHLANMGMVVSLPSSMPLEDALGRFDALLRRVEPDAARHIGHAKHDEDLPLPKPVAPGSTRVVGFPESNASAPGQLLISWPANLTFADPQDRMLSSLFAAALAGDATTNLYKLFLDSKTRQIDVGATGVYAGFSDDPGHAFQVALSDMNEARLKPETIAKVRDMVQAEMRRIAGYKAGSKELNAFNQRVLALVTGTRRGLAKFVNSPPGFGDRGTYSSWLDHLNQLAELSGFEKSVTLDQDLAAIEKALAGQGNLWTARIAAWGLVKAKPIAVGVRPSPELLDKERKAREGRLTAEAAHLEARYGLKGQAALKRYAQDFEAATVALKQAETQGGNSSFLADPPLNRDPDLLYRETKLVGVPVVSSTFSSMGGASVGLAARLDGIGFDDLLYVPLLPSLLTEVGLIVDGKPLSHEEVVRRQRTEILGLDAYFSRNGRTGRVEVALRAAGNTQAEAEKAVAWLGRAILHPDWRPENLSRLRDVVDQAAASLLTRMKGAEEHWVRDPARAYRYQRSPLQLATGSFLTQAHLALRLRWRLRDAGTPAEAKAIQTFLHDLAAVASPKAPAGEKKNPVAKPSKAALAGLLKAISEPKAKRPKVAAHLSPLVAAFDKLGAKPHEHALEAAKDVSRLLADLPDGSLGTDWRMLFDHIAQDLAYKPQTALADLQRVRGLVLRQAGVRLFLVGSQASQDALIAKPLPQLIGQLEAGPFTPVNDNNRPIIIERVRARTGEAPAPFVGLVAPSAQSGVFVHSADGPGYADTDRESLLRFLASQLFAGGGAHSIFMKTWGAGLAYSNGIRGSAETGDVSYYAERCPELPQTLTFVINELKAAPHDAGLVAYALAQAFDDSRAAASFESRGEAIANDLADGVTAEKVKHFREALLDLSRDHWLADALYERLPAVYGTVLPGFGGVDPRRVKGANYFVIGPEKQFVAYEGYLRTAVGPDAKVTRLYPRDFWLVKPI